MLIYVHHQKGMNEMSKALYGSLNNRFDENKYYNGTRDNIKVGTLCTIYYWSDRNAYEVVKVESQDHVYIRQLKAIRTDNWGMSDAQNYRYESDENSPAEEIKLAKNGWRYVNRYTLEGYKRLLARTAEDMKDGQPNEALAKFYFMRNGLTEKQFEKVLSGKEVVRLGSKVNISFGVADEYYDYSF